MFDNLLETFENNDLQNFAKILIKDFPEYFWKVAASSSGKYHPEYALGDGGLMRHTEALVRIMNHLFSIDCIKNQYTSRERDMLRIAGIAHDSMKSGTQAQYTINKFTKFDHPLLAARFVMSYADKANISTDEIKIIANAIASHMGQWCTDKRSPGVMLPTPENKMQIMLHVCDYLASRKDILITFDQQPVVTKSFKEDIITLPFGKYKGKLVEEAPKDYLGWLIKNVELTSPLKEKVEEVLKSKI